MRHWLRLCGLIILFVGLMVGLPVIVQAQTNPWLTAVQSITWFPNRVCTEPLRIKPLGNSITRGKGSDGPDQSGNEGDSLYNHGYRSYLDVSLAAQGYQFDFTGQLVSGELSGLIFDYDHDGFSGMRADELEWAINNTFVFNGAHPPLLPSNPADVVLLHIGTNDIAQGQSTSSTISDVIGILDEIDAYDPEVVVLIALIVDQNPADARYQDGAVSSFNSALETLVNNRINIRGDKLILVDMYKALDYQTDMFDWLHPDESGYEKMANVWLAPLLSIWPTCVAITSTPGTSGFVSQPYAYDVDVISDPQPTAIAYSLLSAPAGMTINGSDGLVSWTPTVSQAGTYTVTVQASSSTSSDTQTFNIMVDAYFDYLPAITH